MILALASAWMLQLSEEQSRTLVAMDKFVAEQTSAAHALESAQYCRRAFEEARATKSNLPASILADGKKTGLNGLQIYGRVHDCTIFAFAYTQGRADEKVEAVSASDGSADAL